MHTESQGKINVSVLLAEDELHARVFTESLLKKMVSRVYTVSTGQDGLEVFKKHPIDIVITDIQMPRLSGLDMLRQMKALKPNLLTLITTAYSETNYFLQAIELGVDRFLLKPFTEETLYEKISFLSNIVLREEHLREEEEARRQAEEQLKRSEEKFRLFFEMSPLGTLIICPSTLTILQSNQAASNILGYLPHELVGKDFRQLTESEEALQFKYLSKIIPYETYLTARDGKVVPVEILTRPLGLHGSEVLLTQFSDISARKQAEEQIYLYQTKLEVLVDKRTAELQDAVQKLTWERDQKTQLSQRLERNIAVEKLISSIAARFINPIWNELETEISEALHSIADFTGMDRAFFWFFEPKTTKLKYRILSNNKSLYAHQVPDEFDLRSMPELLNTLSKGQAYRIDVEHPPQYESEEYKFIRLNKIRRLIIYPVEHQNLLAGFIGLDSGTEGKLPDDMEFVLKITGKVFLDALLHRLNAQEIRNTAEKLTALLNAMPDLLITVNKEGRILEINESAARLFNVRFPLSKPLYFNEIMPHETAAGRWSFVKQVFETGSKRQHLDTLNARKYEHVFFPVSLSNNQVESVGMLSKEVTQVYLYQQQLSDNNQLLKTIINSIPSPLYYKNMQGHILGCNNAFLEFAGVNSFELVGTRLEEILPKEVYELLVQKDENLYRTGEVQTFEIQLNTAGTKPRDIQVTKSLFKDAEGKPAGVVGILVDITEIKRINQELRQLNENLSKRVEEEVQKVEKQHQALIQKSRIESLGQMAAGIAHEINQPLSAISLAMENAYFRLSSGQMDENYLNSKLDTIRQNVNRIKAIIDHVKTFSKPGFTSRFTEIDLNYAVENALLLVNQQLKNQEINLKLNLSQDLVLITGDMIKMEQVIVNLLNNASEAILEKETLMGRFSKTIEISTGIKGKKAYLTVADNGIGIDPATLDKIFEPFFTTKEGRQGTGLGLSIVYSLVNEMKGEIKVKSQLNEGTVFSVTLPLASNTN